MAQFIMNLPHSYSILLLIYTFLSIYAINPKLGPTGAASVDAKPSTKETQGAIENQATAENRSGRSRHMSQQNQETKGPHLQPQSLKAPQQPVRQRPKSQSPTRRNLPKPPICDDYESQLRYRRQPSLAQGERPKPKVLKIQKPALIPKILVTDASGEFKQVIERHYGRLEAAVNQGSRSFERRLQVKEFLDKQCSLLAPKLRLSLGNIHSKAIERMQMYQVTPQYGEQIMRELQRIVQATATPAEAEAKIRAFIDREINRHRGLERGAQKMLEQIKKDIKQHIQEKVQQLKVIGKVRSNQNIRNFGEQTKRQIIENQEKEAHETRNHYNEAFKEVKEKMKELGISMRFLSSFFLDPYFLVFENSAAKIKDLNLKENLDLSKALFKIDLLEATEQSGIAEIKKLRVQIAEVYEIKRQRSRKVQEHNLSQMKQALHRFVAKVGKVQDIQLFNKNIEHEGIIIQQKMRKIKTRSIAFLQKVQAETRLTVAQGMEKLLTTDLSEVELESLKEKFTVKSKDRIKDEVEKQQNDQSYFKSIMWKMLYQKQNKGFGSDQKLMKLAQVRQKNQRQGFIKLSKGLEREKKVYLKNVNLLKPKVAKEGYFGTLKAEEVQRESARESGAARSPIRTDYQKRRSSKKLSLLVNQAGQSLQKLLDISKSRINIGLSLQSKQITQHRAFMELSSELVSLPISQIEEQLFITGKQTSKLHLVEAERLRALNQKMAEMISAEQLEESQEGQKQIVAQLQKLISKKKIAIASTHELCMQKLQKTIEKVQKMFNQRYLPAALSEKAAHYQQAETNTFIQSSESIFRSNVKESLSIIEGILRQVHVDKKVLQLSIAQSKAQLDALIGEFMINEQRQRFQAKNQLLSIVHQKKPNYQDQFMSCLQLMQDEALQRRRKTSNEIYNKVKLTKMRISPTQLFAKETFLSVSETGIKAAKAVALEMVESMAQKVMLEKNMKFIRNQKLDDLLSKTIDEVNSIFPKETDNSKLQAKFKALQQSGDKSLKSIIKVGQSCLQEVKVHQTELIKRAKNIVDAQMKKVEAQVSQFQKKHEAAKDTVKAAIEQKVSKLNNLSIENMVQNEATLKRKMKAKWSTMNVELNQEDNQQFRQKMQEWNKQLVVQNDGIERSYQRFKDSLGKICSRYRTQEMAAREMKNKQLLFLGSLRDNYLSVTTFIQEEAEADITQYIQHVKAKKLQQAQTKVLSKNGALRQRAKKR